MIALHACTVFNNTGLSVRSKKEKRVMDARFITWEFFFLLKVRALARLARPGSVRV